MTCLASSRSQHSPTDFSDAANFLCFGRSSTTPCGAATRHALKPEARPPRQAWRGPWTVQGAAAVPRGRSQGLICSTTLPKWALLDR